MTPPATPSAEPTASQPTIPEGYKVATAPETTTSKTSQFVEDKPVIGRQRRPKAAKDKKMLQPCAKPSLAPTGIAASTSAPANRTDNVWTKAREALLRQEQHDLETPTVYEDEIKYANLYACARKKYNTRTHGNQRLMTALEEETLLEWRKGNIHLLGLPAFMTETHTLKERMAWQRVYLTHMRHRLYVETPPGVRLPMESPTWHLFQKLISKNQVDGAPSATVVRLMTDVSVVHCSPESNLVEFIFDRPEIRDKWTNTTIAFPFGKITLRATDAFTREDPSPGYDDGALRLMYEVHFMGFRHGTPELILAIAEELGRGTPVRDITPIEPAGERRFDPHVWRVTYESLTAPTGIGKIRCLIVKEGSHEVKIVVHHPRAERMHPCSRCLGIGHRKAKCPITEKVDELRAPYTKHTNITLAPLCDMSLPTMTLYGLAAQGTRTRLTLEPELAAATSRDGPAHRSSGSPALPPNSEHDMTKKTKTAQKKKKAKSAASSPAKPIAKAKNQAVEQLRALHAHMTALRTKTAATRGDNTTDPRRIDHETRPQPPGSTPNPAKTPTNPPKARSKREDVPTKLAQPNAGNEEQPSHSNADATGMITSNSTPSAPVAKPASTPEDGHKDVTRMPREPEGAQNLQGDSVMTKTVSDTEHSPGKRRRAPSNVPDGGFDGKPTTSQARANTAHTSVNPRPPLFPNPKESQAARRTRLAAVRAATTRRANGGQLTVSQFMHKATTGTASTSMHSEADGDEEMKSDSFEDELEDPPFETHGADPLEPHYVVVKTQLNVHESETSADGHCGWFSAHGIKTHVDKVIYSTTDTFDRAEGSCYCQATYDELINNYDYLIDTKTLTVDGLRRQYSLSAVLSTADVKRQTLKHWRKAKKWSMKSPRPRDMWVGEAELKGLTWWFGEPIFVFDVMADGRVWLQMYRLELATLHGEQCEVVKTRPLTAEEGHNILRRLLGAHAIPLMLALHHTITADSHTGHYRPLRVEAAHYRSWRRRDQAGQTMEQRRDHILTELGFYVRPPPPVKHKVKHMRAPKESDSASFSASVGSDSAPSDPRGSPPATRARTQQRAHLRLDLEGVHGTVADPIDLVSSASSATAAPSEAASTQPDVVGVALSFTDPASPRRSGRRTSEPIVVPRDPRDPLTVDQTIELLDHLQKQTPGTAELTALLRKAKTHNQRAYVDWKRDYGEHGCLRVDKVINITDLYEAADVLKTEAIALAYMLRSLPYPQVFFATAPERVLILLGRSLITLGREQMLRRLKGSGTAGVPAPLQQICEAWGTAIDLSNQPDQKWVLAQEPNYWSKMGSFSHKYGIAIRLMPHIEAASWFRTVACVLADTDALPPRFRNVPIAQQCDALLLWMAQPGNRADVKTVADALDRRVWSAAAALLPEELLAPIGVPTAAETTISATVARN